MLAKAVQKYGMYVVDTGGGGGFVFRAENPGNQYPGGDPYTKPAGIISCPNPPDSSCAADRQPLARLPVGQTAGSHGSSAPL